jgi:uncharacterized protein (DUF433 family)
MQLEDYFDFTDYEKHGEIRIREHRIWLHDVLVEYLKHGLTTPQQLHDRFPTLGMDEVLACLLYYHANQPAMDRMVENYLDYCKRHREEWERANADKIADLRRRMQEFAASQKATR